MTKMERISLKKDKIKSSLIKMLSFFYQKNGLRKNFRSEEKNLKSRALEIRILWTLSEISKDFGSDSVRIISERETFERFSFLKTEFEDFSN